MDSARIAVMVVDPAAVSELQHSADQLLTAALGSAGLEAVGVPWGAPIAPEDYALALSRQLPDPEHLDEAFFAIAGGVPHLHNPVEMLRWNADKHYLLALSEAGVPVVTTQWLEPDRAWTSRGVHTRLPAMGEFVVKPARGAGMHAVARYTADDGAMRAAAIDQVLALLAQGRSVMVQRYEQGVETRGEVSLVFLDGIYSHAAIRDAQLLADGTAPATPRARAHRATSAEIDTGLAALDALCAQVPCPQGKAPLFARVDLVPGPDAVPLVLEVDVSEAELFTYIDPTAAERTAATLARHAVR